MKRRILASVAVTLMFAALLTATVSASFSDGFDTNSVGTVSPFPWTFGSNNANCWSGAVSTNTPYTPPNDYVFTLAANGATCTQASGNYAELVGNFNASEQVVTLTFYFRSITPSPQGLLKVYAELSDSEAGTVSSSAGAWTANTSYTSITVSAVAKVGSTVTATIMVEIAGTPNGASYTVGVDNVYVGGANAVNPSANFILMNLQNLQWFDINGYPGSYIEIQYLNGNVSVMNNLTYPDLTIPSITNVKYITVWVGSSYSDTFIPSSTGATYAYLAPPSVVQHYDIQVQDLTGLYGPGSTIIVQEGELTVASGYTDAGDSFAVNIPPGTYTVTIQNGKNTYTQTVSLSSVNLNPTIQITAIKVSSGSGFQTAVSWATGWNNPPQDIIVYYNDSTDSTTSLTVQLFLSNATGNYLIYSQTATGRYGTFTAAIPANSNLSSEYMVEVSATDEYGSFILGPTGVTAPGSVFQVPFNVDPNLLGLSYFIPYTWNWEFMFAMIFLVILAGIFGAVGAPFGFLAVAGFAGFFGLAGWLPSGTTIATVAITVGIAAYMVRKERKVPLD